MLKDSKSLWGTPSRQPATDQQRQVVNAMVAGGDHVCIAFAGSGKTATGVEVAHHMAGPGCMLMFNRAAKDDATPRMRAGVAVNTGHSLAYQHVIEPSAGYQAKLEAELNPENGRRLSASLIAQILNLGSTSDPDIPAASQLAMAILKTIEAFQISREREPGPEHAPLDVLPLALRSPDADERAHEVCQRIAEHARALWQRMINERSGIPITHDTYLKILQLREPYFSFDFWILDEYQDTTPVVDELVNQQEGQKLYIGDPYQAIYSWRGAINALAGPIDRGLPVHYLTDSFRYNHQIAGMATLILRALGEPVPVRGQPRNFIHRRADDNHTIICRTNLSILVRAGELIVRGSPVFVDGGIPKSTYQRIESALALFQGRPNDVRISTLRQMGSWTAFVDYARGLGERADDMMNLITLVEQYQSQLPVLIDTLKRRLPYRNPRKPGQTTLITAHRSKGRQFAHVELDPDIGLPGDLMIKIQNQAPLQPKERESLHLLYVALTRAELSLELPKRIKENLKLLHGWFNRGTDTAETFTAKTTIPLPKAHAQTAQRARTEAFIRAHRRTD